MKRLVFALLSLLLVTACNGNPFGSSPAMDLTGHYRVVGEVKSQNNNCSTYVSESWTATVMITQTGNSFTRQEISCYNCAKPVGEEEFRGSINGDKVRYKFAATLKTGIGLVDATVEASGRVTDPATFTLEGDAHYRHQTSRCEVKFSFSETWTRI